MLDDGNNPRGKDALSPCLISVLVIAAGSAALQSDILMIQALKRRHQKSQARLDTDSNTAFSMNVEPKRSVQCMCAPESTHVAKNRSVKGEQDDRDHKIDNIIEKEVDGETAMLCITGSTCAHSQRPNVD